MRIGERDTFPDSVAALLARSSPESPGLAEAVEEELRRCRPLFTLFHATRVLDPQAIREGLAARGHGAANHAWAEQMSKHLTPEQFERAKEALGNLTLFEFGGALWFCALAADAASDGTVPLLVAVGGERIRRVFVNGGHEDIVEVMTAVGHPVVVEVQVPWMDVVHESGPSAGEALVATWFDTGRDVGFTVVMERSVRPDEVVAVHDAPEFWKSNGGTDDFGERLEGKRRSLHGEVRRAAAESGEGPDPHPLFRKRI